MTNEEQLGQLKQGIGEWNVWSAKNSKQIDLSGAHLRQADLSWAHLSGANLRQADLSGANFNGADLSEAHPFGAIIFGEGYHVTVFAQNDLTSVMGLETIVHHSPSRIDFRTMIFPAPGPILTTFLRGAGSSEYLIEVVNGRILPLQPVSVKVFISFASSDQDLCQNLRDHLSGLVRSGMITLSHEEVLVSNIHQWEKRPVPHFRKCM